MPDYSQGKIYTIRNKTDDTLIYVGSTCQNLAMRMAGHRGDSKKEKYKNSLFYNTVAGDWSNWFIELYEDFPCERLEQLRQREGQVQREIGTLNVRIENRTVEERRKKWYDVNPDYNKEYRLANFENIHEKQKEYRQANREKFCEKAKEYYQANTEKCKEYYQANTDKFKEYQRVNKDKLKEYQRAYYLRQKAEKEASKTT